MEKSRKEYQQRNRKRGKEGGREKGIEGKRDRGKMKGGTDIESYLQFKLRGAYNSFSMWIRLGDFNPSPTPLLSCYNKRKNSTESYLYRRKTFSSEEASYSSHDNFMKIG